MILHEIMQENEKKKSEIGRLESIIHDTEQLRMQLVINDGKSVYPDDMYGIPERKKCKIFFYVIYIVFLMLCFYIGIVIITARVYNDFIGFLFSIVIFFMMIVAVVELPNLFTKSLDMISDKIYRKKYLPTIQKINKYNSDIYYYQNQIDKIKRDIEYKFEVIKKKEELLSKIPFQVSEELINIIYNDKTLNNLVNNLHKFHHASTQCYTLKNHYLSSTEITAYQCIEKIALSRNIFVSINARMMDVLKIVDLSKYGERYKEQMGKFYSNIIQSKHIDFILFNQQGEILLCIELDDPSHFNYFEGWYTHEKVKADFEKDIIFYYTGIPFLRVDYDSIDKLPELILQILDKKMYNPCDYRKYTKENIELYFESLKHLSVNT